MQRGFGSSIKADIAKPNYQRAEGETGCDLFQSFKGSHHIGRYALLRIQLGWAGPSTFQPYRSSLIKALETLSSLNLDSG